MLISDEVDDEHGEWSTGAQANGSQRTNDGHDVSLLAEEKQWQNQSKLHSAQQLQDTAVKPPSPSGSVPPAHRPFLYLLCVCSFFVTFRPSEPFLTPYLIDYKALGADAVNERVYPTWTYSYFAFLLPAGVLGEVLGYRAMIAAQLLSLLATYSILIWAEGLQWMQFMQVTFGFSSAVQSCVFFTYIYRCSPVEIYPTVVSAIYTCDRSWAESGPVAAIADDCCITDQLFASYHVLSMPDCLSARIGSHRPSSVLTLLYMPASFSVTTMCP